MFISPILDGWTLVFGTPKRVISQGNEAGNLEPRHDDLFPDGEHVAEQRRCVELSPQFGTVYWYVQAEVGGCGDWMGWCFAQRGSLIRYYHHDFYEGEIEVGKPLAANNWPAHPGWGGGYPHKSINICPHNRRSPCCEKTLALKKFLVRKR